MNEQGSETQSVARYGDPKIEPGELLTASKRKAARLAVQIWESRDADMKKRLARWRVNELRREGMKNVSLRYTTDDRSWIAYVPPYLEKTPDALTALNKAADLCRRLPSLMFADPPATEASPPSGEDEDRDAAEFATRMLADLHHRVGSVKKAIRAFDRASTFGSGFVYTFVNPKGGGRYPLQVSAGKFAERYDDALINPETGLPWTELAERFVAGDGRLTDDPAEAAQRWLPEIEEIVLTGRNVRLMPHSAEDVTEAYGCQIGYFMPFGKLRRLYPGLDDLSEEEVAKVTAFAPTCLDYIATKEERRVIKNQPENPDERLVFCLTTYFTTCDDYEDGAYVVSLGDVRAVVQEEWAYETDDGRVITLPLPVSQYMQWEEGQSDPYKFGVMDIVGEGNEIRAAMIGALLDHVEHLLNRKTFVPMHSNLKPKDFQLPGRYLPIIPGTEPKTEEIPAFPNDGMNLMRMTTDEMERSVVLTQVAQGIESPQVQSGRHAQAIIGQVHASLSELRMNVENAWTCQSKIQLELVKAYYDAPRRIGWVGEDGAYKERRWMNADLRSTTDVHLARGSLTMLAPVHKAQLAEHFAQFGLLQQFELREIVSSNLGGMLGVQDDPFLLRVRRQIAVWLEGPPGGWAPVPPMPGQPPEPDPLLGQIWAPVQSDDEPYVALTRQRELAKLMSRAEYMTKPPEWRQPVETEYQRAKQAATGQTPGAPQVGQPPAQAQSPAQRTEGPMAPPATPVPGIAPTL